MPGRAASEPGWGTTAASARRSFPRTGAEADGPSAAFARAVGGRLFHVTAARNLPRIRAEGLRPAADLAASAGVDPDAIRHRTDPVALPGALLNHQRPLRMGRGKTFLDPPLTLADWAALLDQRVFLWPSGRGRAFAASLAGRDAAVLTIDAARLHAALAPDLWLSPINSGDASRRPARRGLWLWVPATELDAFAVNRMRRGLAARPDRVAEVSVTALIPPDLIRFPHGC